MRDTSNTYNKGYTLLNLLEDSNEFSARERKILNSLFWEERQEEIRSNWDIRRSQV